MPISRQMASLPSFLAAGALVLVTLVVPCSSCIESFDDATDYFAMASQQTQPVPREELSSAPHVIDYGPLFNISYGLHFKVVTEHYSKEQYVLWLCGTARPSNETVNAVESLPAGFMRKYFSIPLQTVALSSTVQLPFFAELGIEDRISYGPSWATSPCAQKLLGCGLQWEESDAMRAGVEAVFVGCSNPDDCAQDEPKSIVFSGTFDPSNLGIAEHIKFLSTFFNKEEEAETYFQDVLTTYRASKAPLPTEKTVAWIARSTYSTVDQFVVSLAEYKAEYVADANAENVDLNQIADQIASKTGSNTTVRIEDVVIGFRISGKTLVVPITAEFPAEQASQALFGALMDVDVVIDESYSSTPVDYKLEDFFMKYALNGSENLSFLVNNKVFRIDGRISPGNGYDWYESRFAYPHLVLEDVVRAISTGGESQTFTYLRNLATGEMPSVLDSAMCEDVNCTAPPSTTPSTTESNDASHGARSTAGPRWEFVAGAAAVVMLLRASFA